MGIVENLIRKAEVETPELVTTIKTILSEKVDSISNSRNNCAIHVASLNGFVEICRLLLSAGAKTDWSANNTDSEGTVINKELHPIHFAAKSGKDKVVALLLDHGADINAGTGCDSTALMWSCQEGHLEVCKLLIARGAGLLIVNSSKKSAMHYALEHERWNVAELLIQSGFSVNYRIPESQALLHWVCQHGLIEAVSWLLDHGADIDILTNWHTTPVMYAAQAGHLEIVKLLVRRGADLTVKSGESCAFKTALDWSRESKKIEVIKYLEELNQERQAKQLLEEREKLIRAVINDLDKNLSTQGLLFADSARMASLTEKLVRLHVYGEEISDEKEDEVTSNNKVRIAIKLNGEPHQIKKLEDMFANDEF